MYYKIIEKKTILESQCDLVSQDILGKAISNETKLLNNFLQTYDSKVKVIHVNQEIIKNDLDTLFKQSEEISKITKDATRCYDEFIEYMKEVGDLYNYSTILEEEVNSLHDKILNKYS